MALPTFFTAEMVRAMPDDGRRYETVHGELLVTPAPRLPHQLVLGRLFLRVVTYAEAHRLGTTFLSPADISWGDDTLVQPDLFVVPLAEARTRDWRGISTLLLAVEILSRSSLRADRFTKRRLYQEVGVPLYWVIDPDTLRAEVWTPDTIQPRHASERLVWHPPGAPEPLVIELGELGEI